MRPLEHACRLIMDTGKKKKRKIEDKDAVNTDMKVVGSERKMVDVRRRWRLVIGALRRLQTMGQDGVE